MLTPDDIKALAGQGETLTVEFKGERREPLRDAQLVEAAVCLANTAGGWLLVGVEDDGTVTGARPRHEGGATDPRRVEALVSSKTRPALAVRAECVDHPSGQVLAIEVPRGTVPVATSRGRYMHRITGGDGKPACQPWFVFEMSGATYPGGSPDPSAQVVSGVTWGELDPLEFDRLRRMIRESRGRGDTGLLDLSNIDLAKALGAIEANGDVRAVRLLGVLLFASEDVIRRTAPCHEVAFQVLRGTRIAVNDFFRWPLLRLFEELSARFDRYNEHQEVDVGLFRMDVHDYPVRAVREALANALVHRDYNRLGAVHVQLGDDRLRIDNPGGFPEGVRLDNLLVTAPRPRNPLLADAFKRAGLVDRTGRGVNTIYEELLRSGRPAPDYGLSTEAGVTVIIPGGAANLELAAFVAQEGREGRPLSLEDLLVLHELQRERSVDARRVARLIQRDEEAARRVLGRLRDAGFVESRGRTRGASYHLTASVYRALGERSGYVRAKGFDAVQQEQMVLQYVRAHGAIRRAEVMDLCHLNGNQASYLLRRMVSQRLLEPRGAGRSRHYVESRD
ncbi:MAG: ATP-binding protein [Myxococcota bacterium]